MKYMIKKIIIGTAIGILLFLFRSYYVSAAALSDPLFAGKRVGDTFYISSNSYVQGSHGMVLNNVDISTTTPNFIFIDVCTTGNEPSFRIISNTSGIILHSNKSFRLVNDFCDINVDGTIYRNQPIYRQIISIIKINQDSTILAIDGTSRIWSETNYNVAMRIYNMGISYDYPLEAITQDQNQTMINILTEIRNKLNTLDNATVTQAINNQTNVLKSELQEIDQTQEEIRDFLKDTSTPNNSDYNFDSYNQDNGVITNLLTLPITLTQGILNGLNNGCSAYNFGSIKGQNISFPCINPGQHLGVAWNVIDIILSGVFIFIFGKKCITIFNDVTNLRSNQVDEVFK